MHVDRFPHCKPLEQLSKTRLPQQNNMGNPWKSPIFVVCQRTTCSPSGFLEELVALFPVLFSLTMASRNVCAMQAFSMLPQSISQGQIFADSSTTSATSQHFSDFHVGSTCPVRSMALRERSQKTPEPHMIPLRKIHQGF